MQRYLEVRTITSAHLTAGADLARHLLARQHLGKVVIVCDKPLITMSVVRKYLFRLTRSLQKERSSTLNAERILQLTYDITHMQRMEFVARPFPEAPEADVFFLDNDQLSLLPPRCYSLYLLAESSKKQLQAAVAQLPQNALVIDYSHSQVVIAASLLPKHELEAQLAREWQRVESFLRGHAIELRPTTEYTEPILYADELLDEILDVSNSFLRVSDAFLELLRLCQPLDVPSVDQRRYNLIASLNRRVYALTPGTFSQQFISVHDDDSALHDRATQHLALVLSV